jgi:hypothetical protein
MILLSEGVSDFSAAGKPVEPHAVILKRSRSVIYEVTAIKTFVGLDVSQKKTGICVIDHNGNKIRMANVDTHPGIIAVYLFSEGFDDSKVGLETGPLCVRLYHALKSFGLNIDCIHAHHFHATLSMQLNKTDQNDAFGIARGPFRMVQTSTCHKP